MARFLRILMFLLFAVLPSAAYAGPVGFQHFRTPEGVEVGIWYPAEAGASAENAPVAGRGHPLVVMSHGTGGSYDGHSDTATALAGAGFVVAALTHPGDNWQDQGRVLHVEDRPRALSALISYMLADWSGHAAIDRNRVGAFGFSAGGFTVLAAAGGVPNLKLVVPHCVDHPAFFDCRMVSSHGGAVAPAEWRGDARIRAVVAAAPALGFTFGKTGLRGVRVPVQLWKAGDDRILPAPFYADAVHDALPKADFHVEPGAGHFDFLKPCPEALAKAVPQICTSAPGFNRAAFHARFNAAVVGFFERTLRR